MITTITQPRSTLQTPPAEATYDSNDTYDETVGNIEVEEVDLDNEDVIGTLARYHHFPPLQNIALILHVVDTQLNQVSSTLATKMDRGITQKGDFSSSRPRSRRL